MNKKIAEAFADGKAFIPFVTCGDPSLDVTEQLVYAMTEAGADLIELGIPFSDPTAEGPVIQAANVRALSGGVTTDKIFDMVISDLSHRFCRRCRIPSFLQRARPAGSVRSYRYRCYGKAGEGCKEYSVCRRLWNLDTAASR